MIDTHCHLLPGLDDGPATVDESVELAIEMVAQGVKSVVCTPHLSRQFPVPQERALEALEALQLELGRRRIDLPLTLAAEVSDVNAVTLDAAALRERSIGGGTRRRAAPLRRLCGRALTRRLRRGQADHRPSRAPEAADARASLDGVRARGLR
jgi:hypothetical protein